jgi:hypothetical protein
MKYIVTRPKPRTEKLTLEDILFDLVDDIKLAKMNTITTPTATKVYEVTDWWFQGDWSEHRRLIYDSLTKLREFYTKYKQYDIFFDPDYNYEEQLKVQKRVEKELIKEGIDLTPELVEEKVKEELAKLNLKYNPYYYTFYLPKKSGSGWRQIDAPTDDFKLVLRELKLIIEQMMSFNTYHTSAYAYIQHRSRVDLVQKLKSRKSRWLLKLDFSNFFGSITLDWTMEQLGRIYPFSEIIRENRELMEACMRLCFLDGRLPQGTPISPLLTNILMIPIDFKITNKLLKEAQQITEFDKDDHGDKYDLVYTRYADDIIIGSHRGFKYAPVINYIRQVLAEFNAPMQIKPEKTKYGNTSGQSWILGLMYNSDYTITIGHKNKRQIKAMINNFAMDYLNHQDIDPGDVHIALGKISYLNSIEPDFAQDLLGRARQKYGIDIVAAMKTVAYA